MERDRILQALNTTLQSGAAEQKAASEYLDQSAAAPPSSRPRHTTVSSDGASDWLRLSSLTADSVAPEESPEQRQSRVRGLMRRWRSAALRARRLLRDPWVDFNMCSLPIIRAKRHRYSSIRKIWTVDIVEVKLLAEPFARGAMRECFRLKKLSTLSRSMDWATATNYVAKKYIQEVDREVLFEDVRLQMDAKLWSEEFNRHAPPKKIDIMQMCVLEMLDLPGQPLFHLEHFIEGDYVKYNSNSGFVSDVARKTPQAFSHFTFERSGHQMIIVDVQGVGDLYTDPQIHTVAGTDYGDGNLGTRGMALFFHSHECNDICHSLCLTEFDLSDAERRALAEGAASCRAAATRCVARDRGSVSACEALVAEREEDDAMECLRRRTLSVISNGSSSGGRTEGSLSKGSAGHDDDCLCDDCLDRATKGFQFYEDEGVEDGEDEDTKIEESQPRPIRKVALPTLAVEEADEEECRPGMRRNRYDSLGSSYGESLGSSSLSRLTRDTEREEYWQAVARKQSVPAGVLSAIQHEQLAAITDAESARRVSHRASVLGQIHLDIARYHELGRFIDTPQESAEKRVALLGEEGSREEGVAYDKQSALFHLDVARRCGVLEAIVTIAQMAYGLPHDLLKDIGEDECWEEEFGTENHPATDKEAFAFELMETAAEMGDRAAMLFVAEAFETGRRMGVKGIGSYPKAIEWYQKAMGFDEESADGGGACRPRFELLAKMAEMYREGGYGLEQDYGRAYNLFTEAAEVAMEAMKGKLANKYYELAEMCAL